MCGRGKLFRGWFTMHAKCPACGGDFHRGEGFFLGSIYFNYGLTALIVAVAYPLLHFNHVLDGLLPRGSLLWMALAFVIFFPLLFFRHARSLWLAFDQFYDPREGETGTRREA